MTLTRRNFGYGFILFCSICLAGYRLAAGFIWTGYIDMTPENGIVETGNSISMEIVDSFEVTELPDDEYPISEGEPTYEWFVNGADTPCKTGKQVTFTTGDANADILTGDFTVEVKGSRTYTIPNTGCTCGCGDPLCRCQEQRGQSECKGCQKLKSDQSRASNLQMRDVNGQSFGIEHLPLGRVDGAATRVIVSYNGVHLPTTISVKAGSQIELSAKLDKSAKGPKTYRWTIPGVKFKSFNENDPSHPLTSFENSVELEKKNPIFYWSDGADNRVVRCDVTVKGKTLSGTMSFNVLRPDISITVGCVNHYCLYPKDGILFLRYFDTVLRYGIKFRYSPPSVNSIYATDSFCWVQVADYARFDYDGHTISNTNALDSSFPYSSSIEANDGPGMPLIAECTNASQMLIATMYLMYKPATVGAAWIPLKKVKWLCQGKATKNNNNEWEIDANSSGRFYPIQETYTHPNWETLLNPDRTISIEK